MGDGTEASPYTRDDVLRLIKIRGGTAYGLDLSGKWFEREIDLKELDLNGIILNKAHLLYAQLEETALFNAQLEEATLFNAQLENTILPGAHLERADLQHANLDGAILWDVNLEGANMMGATFSASTEMDTTHWGNYILSGEQKDYNQASATYRRLKQWYTTAGMYDVAGKFYYREMECKRKGLSWRRKFWSKLWNTIYWGLCGYGEKPERIVINASLIIFGLSLIYFAGGKLMPNSFWDCLYYSAASFTALGYGGWVTGATGFVRWLGVGETFIGVFMTGLFLVTFTRKMTR
ncbi:MAG: pentapeptide repeat-containing protein [Chloroflexota bacterium]